MKKIFALILALMMMTVCVSALGAAEGVDVLTTPSASRKVMMGADFDAGVEALIAVSGDLATKAQTEAEGYVAPEGRKYAQVMSVNADGSISMSTIHNWKAQKTDDGAMITIIMMEGTTIGNLIEVGKRGTVMINTENGYYMNHVEAIDVQELKYDAEKVANGEFDPLYTGSEENPLSQYTVTLNVYEMLNTRTYRFD